MLRPIFASALLTLTIGSTLRAEENASPWSVPGDVQELSAACSTRPGLETFGQNGQVIECGYQGALLGDRLPIGPAPHVPWAKPYARGRIKLLIVTSFACSPADVEQLAQAVRALDVDVRWLLVAESLVTSAAESDYGYRTRYLPEQARTLLRDDYDAILMTFGSLRPNFGVTPAHAHFPDNVYRTILDKVRRGTGLVIVGQNAGGFWPEQTPLAAALPAHMAGSHVQLPPSQARLEPTPLGAAFAGVDYRAATFTPFILYGWQLHPDARVLAQVAGRPAVMVREHGQGRVVLLGWDGTLGPQRSGGRAELEHATALGLRALAYAARKEPELRLTLAAERLAAGEPGKLSLRASRALRLELELRDDNYRPVSRLALQVPAGASWARLPALAGGSYQLQAIAKDAQGRVLWWGDQRLDVAPALALRLSTDRESYQVGDVVHVRVGPAVASGLEASWEVRDAAGRVLARSTAAASSFDYAIRAARVAPHRVLLRLSRAGRPLAAASTSFFVPGPGWDDYENVLWPTRAGARLDPVLRDTAGITALLDGYGGDATSSNAAHYGLSAARVNDAPIEPGQLQTQPQRAGEASSAALASAISAAQRYGALFWVLQDERHRLDDAGMPDAEGLSRYRDYLRARYGGLPALNASWGTQHASWEQIRPSLTSDVQAGVKNLAPWVDFRLYVADQAFRLDAAHAAQLRAALGAHVHVGLDGFGLGGHTLPYAALDVGRLGAEGVLDFFAPYEEDFLIASMVSGPRAKYAGWSTSRADYFSAPWRDAFRGYLSSVRFVAPSFYSDFGFLQPAGRWTGESTRELRSGVGKLLLGSRRELSPIVLLYSYPSLVTGSGAGHWEPRHGGSTLSAAAAVSRSVLEQALARSGVAFGYQTEAQLASGGLAGKQLLIITRQMGVALAPETLRAIERFVRDGGSVLADLAPALCDAHGKPRSSGGLDALFGVHSAGESVVSAGLEFGATVEGQDPLLPQGEWLMDPYYDRSLRLGDGRALGRHVRDNAPAFVVKQTGRGRSLLLNSVLASASPSQNVPGPEQLALVRQLLAGAGVVPFARVQARSGAPETHCELNRFRDGSNVYLGIYAHADPESDPAEVRVRFEDDRHTYDVRAGRYLGEVRELPLPLRAGEAALFARLDYRLTSLALQPPPRAARGELIAVPVLLEASARPGRHVVHVEVRGPGGASLPLYTRNLELAAGRGELQLATALNDPPGRWQIDVREVVSGLTASASVEVQ